MTEAKRKFTPQCMELFKDLKEHEAAALKRGEIEEAETFNKDAQKAESPAKCPEEVQRKCKAEGIKCENIFI